MGCVMSRRDVVGSEQKRASGQVGAVASGRKKKVKKQIGGILMMESVTFNCNDKSAAADGRQQMHRAGRREQELGAPSASSLLALLKRRGSPKIDTCSGCSPLQVVCRRTADRCNQIHSDNALSASGQQVRRKDVVTRQSAGSSFEEGQTNLKSGKRKSENENRGACGVDEEVRRRRPQKMHATSSGDETPADVKFIVSQAEESSSLEQSTDTSSNALNETEDHVKTTHHQRSVDSSDESARLFTSIQLLCSDIIAKDLLGQRDNQEACDRLLCLFSFGCQGSSKGEIAFELVQHSPLLGAPTKLDDKELPRGLKKDSRDCQTTLCPLYHYIDVTSLIVANIDARIQEYQRLVALTSQTRRRQLAILKRDTIFGEGSRQLSADELASNAGREEEASKNDIDDSISADSSSLIGHKRRSLTSSTTEASSTEDASDAKSVTTEMEQTFASLITLTTKQRSILQLKLIKYSNSITSKWVFGLIQRQVETLEAQLREKLTPDAFNSCAHRVYVINLIPNQLSLFRSCLYLQQSLSVPPEFRYPFWAINFEKRTNIRLLGKERAVNKDTGSQDAGGGKSTHLKLSNMRLPRLGVLKPSTTTVVASSASERAAQGSSKAQSIVPAATNVLASNLNEKLGPKFNENFVQHFKRLNRLIKVRYNPTRDYNYAHEQDEDADGPASWSQINQESHTTVTSIRTSSSMQHLVAQQIDTTMVPDSSARNQRLSLTRVSPLESASNLSPARNTQPLLCSTPSLLSNLATSSESELMTSEDHLAPQQSTRQVSQAVSRPNSSGCVSASIKWAIELELVDSSAPHARAKSADQESGELTSGPKTGSFPAIVFSQRRLASRSPFAFASNVQHQRRASAASYRLVPVRVAYANEQSRIRFEVKRVHKRQVKLKSQGDFARLWKLVTKVKSQVQEDCSMWLYEAIRYHSNKSKQPSLASGVGARPKRHSVSIAEPWPSADQHQLPALVVYTIRVDVGRLHSSGLLQLQSGRQRSDHQPGGEIDLRSDSSPATSERRPLIPILTLNGEQARRQKDDATSNLSDRPSSSRPASASTKPKRHVQFRLNQAPISSDGRGLGEFDSIKVERRHWVDASVFISSDEVNSHLMEPVATIMQSRLKD